MERVYLLLYYLCIIIIFHSLAIRLNGSFCTVLKNIVALDRYNYVLSVATMATSCKCVGVN